MARSDTWIKKGQVLNPRGPRRGMAYLAKLIRAETGDGQELVEFALKVLRNQSTTGTPLGYTVGDQKWACEFLAARGFGKPVELHVIDSAIGRDAPQQTITAKILQRATDEEIEKLIELHERSKDVIEIEESK